MCERSLSCPRCDALLTDADEVRCSRSSMGTDMAWNCRRCGSSVALTSKPATFPSGGSARVVAS